MLGLLALSFLTKPVVFWSIIAAAALVELFLVALIMDTVNKAKIRKLKEVYEPDEDAPAPVFTDALTAQQKEYYDVIVAHVNESKDITVNSAKDCEEFRMGKFRVLRFVLKNEVLFAQLVTYGKDFQAQIYGSHADAEFSLNVIAVDSASAVRDVKAAYNRVVASIPTV